MQRLIACKLFCCIVLLAATAPAGFPQQSVRIAAFNTSLNRDNARQLYEDLKNNDNQAASIACIIQHVRPDILLLNEFDFDIQKKALLQFLRILSVSQQGEKPILYPYCRIGSVNTGIPSGFDLDHDGKIDGPGDAFGFGQFPGQYGMVLLSNYPIVFNEIRTFQNFLWKDMPDSMLPTDWYDSETLNILRLSSKNHWDIPIKIQNEIIHILASHPTPPVFDGPEDRNGRRNHDEIRFWADYITPEKSGYIYDDNGKKGGLDANSLFVILGDMNADPCDGDSTGSAINQLLDCPTIQVTEPASAGAVQAAAQSPQWNTTHKGRPQLDTYQSPPDKAPGNLRLDYILPSRKIKIADSGVFWPKKENSLSKEITVSDHRMVYVDILPDRSH